MKLTYNPNATSDSITLKMSVAELANLYDEVEWIQSSPWLNKEAKRVRLFLREQVMMIKEDYLVDSIIQYHPERGDSGIVPVVTRSIEYIKGKYSK